MKIKIAFIFLILTFTMLSSCDLFPYVNQPTTQPTIATPVSLTPSATIQPTPTPTHTPLQPTATTNPTSTQTPSPYVLKAENPFYLENFNHPLKGCQWMGVAGQVFDHLGQPQLGLIVRAGGMPGEQEFLEATTGLVIAYGPGGYEIKLGDSPAETSQTYWIQILDETKTALTDKVYFDTLDDCSQNLIILNFFTKEISEEKAPAATATPLAYP